MQVGRLEVGTETIIDKSKSVKSVLMALFDHGDIEGVDTTNACYGGTSALFNAWNWLESDLSQGKLAIVVAADIAVYKSGSARPTGGVGAVAILLGRNAPLVFDKVRSTFMDHAWDFYKPDLHSEYPIVDGPLSNLCYLKALDTTYRGYLDKFEKLNRVKADRSVFDFMCFHTPYNKLIQKSYGRLSWSDFKRGIETESLMPFANTTETESYTLKELEKSLMGLTKQSFEESVSPCAYVAKNVGNMYCASLYSSLASLLDRVSSDELMGKRIGFFSYGSGLAASMFSVKVVAPVTDIQLHLGLSKRLQDRTIVSPERFDQIMNLREKTHNMVSYTPVSKVDETNLFPGTYRLVSVDDKFRRTYERFMGDNVASVTL